MSTLRLAFLFILFLFLGGPVLFLPIQAYALCSNPCMCGWGCYDGCQCPGTNGCAWCATPDSENLQVKALPSETRKVVHEPVPAIAINARIVDRLIRRVGTGFKIGQCAQNNFRLKITDGDSSLKLDQVFLEENLTQENAEVFQIAKYGQK